MSAVSISTDIRTLLKLALPIGSRQFTGHPETTVNWVCHLRARPPLFSDIEGGELVLLSTQTLANYRQPLSLEHVIEKLAQTQASALGVQGTITPRARQVANTHNFPLIALPDRAALPQVGRDIQRLLTNPQAQLTHRAFELQQTLQRHAAGYRGLTTMLTALARMLDRPVVIYNRRGDVLCRGLPASNEQNWDAHRLLAEGADYICRLDRESRAYTEHGWQVIESPVGLTAPLLHERRMLGYVMVLNTGGVPDEFDVLALEYSAPIFVRELIRHQTTDFAPEPAYPTRDWITDWLTGLATDDALLTLRAEKEGYQAGMWYAAILFQWVSTYGTGYTFSPEHMVRLMQAEMHQRRIPAPVGLEGERVVLLFPLDEPQQTQRLKQTVRLLDDTLSEAATEGEVIIGVGRPAMGLTDLRESVQQAQRALVLSEQLADESRIAFFGDLSLYELLLGVNDPAVLSRFCDYWLAPLIEYDGHHHTDLLPTLDAYFANNGNMARTAHLLNIHRNTLVYRLSRITEILQLDMDDSNVRLNLHLALKIQRMLNAPEGETGD